MPEKPTLPAEPIDLRLVVSDMDGTLLDGEGRLPEATWELLDTLQERGIVFAPASGRQYPSLARLFGERADSMAFIAENGTLVVRGGEAVSSQPLQEGFSAGFIEYVRTLVRGGEDLGLVRCGARTAYIDRVDDAFVAQVRHFYAAVEIVPDVAEVADPALKFAVYDFNDAETGSAPTLARWCAPHQVVVAGEHWIDVMGHEVNKAVALASLQQELGITADQTVVFGDYLNDLEMLAAAPYSFAMANAHPEAKRAARYIAPSNVDLGVHWTVDQLLAC